jgi:hypothetical protein
VHFGNSVSHGHGSYKALYAPTRLKGKGASDQAALLHDDLAIIQDSSGQGETALASAAIICERRTDG